jgi:dTDP-4-dehydrorhamnose reductase
MALPTLLVTGARGRVGRAVARDARARGYTVHALGRGELDITEGAAVRKALDAARPHWVIHCAAFTDVDGAERDPAAARAVNVVGTGNVAEAASRVDAGLVYLSTDYVFDGKSEEPYRPDDAVTPISSYGRSKAEGEDRARRVEPHLVVRTSWVFGGGEGGFARFVLGRSRSGETLRVVRGERSRPTLDSVLAEGILDLLEEGARGTFHVACSGTASRVELARAIVEAAGGTSTVGPVDAEAFGADAPRPPFSVLDLRRTEEVLGRSTLHWREAIRRWATGARKETS